MRRQMHRGQTLLEYALLLALLSVVGISILTVLGRKVRDTFVTVNDAMITASVDYSPGTTGGTPEPPPPPPPPEDWWTPFFNQEVAKRSPPLPFSLAQTLALQALAREIDARGGYSDQQKSEMLNGVLGGH